MPLFGADPLPKGAFGCLWFLLFNGALRNRLACVSLGSPTLHGPKLTGDVHSGLGTCTSQPCPPESLPRERLATSTRERQFLAVSCQSWVLSVLLILVDQIVGRNGISSGLVSFTFVMCLCLLSVMFQFLQTACLLSLLVFLVGCWPLRVIIGFLLCAQGQGVASLRFFCNSKERKTS